MHEEKYTSHCLYRCRFDWNVRRDTQPKPNEEVMKKSFFEKLGLHSKVLRILSLSRQGVLAISQGPEKCKFLSKMDFQNDIYLLFAINFLIICDFLFLKRQ